MNGKKTTEGKVGAKSSSRGVRLPSPGKPSAAPSTTPSEAEVPRVRPSAIKDKLVRDSFTIPKSEYLVLASLKQRAADLRKPAKKSELLRAGISVLQAMSDRAFLLALSKVPSLKTGRPKASKTLA